MRAATRDRLKRLAVGLALFAVSFAVGTMLRCGPKLPPLDDGAAERYEFHWAPPRQAPPRPLREA